MRKQYECFMSILWVFDLFIPNSQPFQTDWDATFPSL